MNFLRLRPAAAPAFSPEEMERIKSTGFDKDVQRALDSGANVIGIYTGGFFPVHNGHVAVVRNSIRSINAVPNKKACVIVMPTFSAYSMRKVPVDLQQHAAPLATNHLLLTQIAFLGVESTIVSRFDLELSAFSDYPVTVDLAARWIKNVAGDKTVDVCYIAGADHAIKCVDDTPMPCPVLVASRPTRQNSDVPQKFGDIVETGITTDISSTEIRNNVLRGISVRGRVPNSLVGALETLFPLFE